MSIENQLDLRASMAKSSAEEYMADSEYWLSDEFDANAFQEAMREKTVAQWAVNTQIKASYTTAKKIIDTI